MKLPQILLTLPVMDESANLPALIRCLREQTFQRFRLIACINNYDDWWQDSAFRDRCLDNLKSLDYLRSVRDMDITLIDRASLGSGWPERKGGVGWARKLAMDQAAAMGEDEEIMISMDADTHYPPEFIEAVTRRFNQAKRPDGLAIPYYHRLEGDETDRLILRYEIYMRHYLLNLLMIESPYAFTALGSAMAVTVKAYKHCGGLTPVMAGEDFYFLQKLVKCGRIGIWAETTAYPSPRMSDRVVFGTGPALIRGATGDWGGYPLYPPGAFRLVRQTFESFHSLFETEVSTPMDEFLKMQMRTDNIWEPLRKNFKDRDNFVRACINRVDGLRILQFLRQQRKKVELSDEEILRGFIRDECFTDAGVEEAFLALDLQNSSVSMLGEVRDLLYEKEIELRKVADEVSCRKA